MQMLTEIWAQTLSHPDRQENQRGDLYVVCCGHLPGLILAVVLGFAPLWTLLGLVTIVIAIPTVKGALKTPMTCPKLLPSLGQNVMLNLITPLLMGIGFLIG
jgi:1,4-dihydroxy-2-naphthoate octaprenyltransferase